VQRLLVDLQVIERKLFDSLQSPVSQHGEQIVHLMDAERLRGVVVGLEELGRAEMGHDVVEEFLVTACFDLTLRLDVVRDHGIGIDTDRILVSGKAFGGTRRRLARGKRLDHHPIPVRKGPERVRRRGYVAGVDGKAGPVHREGKVVDGDAPAALRDRGKQAVVGKIAPVRTERLVNQQITARQQFGGHGLLLVVDEVVHLEFTREVRVRVQKRLDVSALAIRRDDANGLVVHTLSCRR
jgi:hypothetical protein